MDFNGIILVPFQRFLTSDIFNWAKNEFVNQRPICCCLQQFSAEKILCAGLNRLEINFYLVLIAFKNILQQDH